MKDRKDVKGKSHTKTLLLFFPPLSLLHFAVAQRYAKSIALGKW